MIIARGASDSALMLTVCALQMFALLLLLLLLSSLKACLMSSVHKKIRRTVKRTYNLRNNIFCNRAVGSITVMSPMTLHYIYCYLR